MQICGEGKALSNFSGRRNPESNNHKMLPKEEKTDVLKCNRKSGDYI